MATMANSRMLPELPGALSSPREPRPPPRPKGDSQSARVPRAGQAQSQASLMSIGSEASSDAMFATHLRRMAPDVLARELKTIMDEVTLVKLEKKAEVEELEYRLHQAELEVAEARHIKNEVRQFKADQEVVIEEKEEIIRAKDSDIKALERDKKQLQRGLADMAVLAEEEKVLMVKERDAFEAQISKTLQDVREDNLTLKANYDEIAAQHDTVASDKQRIVDSARTAKLGLLKELKEAKITMDQTEQERQDEVEKMSGLATRVEELGTQLLQYVEENTDLKMRSSNAEEAVTRMARQMEPIAVMPQRPPRVVPAMKARFRLQNASLPARSTSSTSWPSNRACTEGSAHQQRLASGDKARQPAAGGSAHGICRAQH